MMKPNELQEWHKLSEKLVAFTSNCSEDIKPYIVGQLQALLEILSAQIDFEKWHCPRFCVNRKLEDSSFILESCFQI